jgi:iron-sulfur cluster repair protein YtfE (RIC family)
MNVPTQAFIRLMKTESEHRAGTAVSTSDEPHFDGREMAMVHRMFRRESLLAADVVRRVECCDTSRARIVAAHLRLIGTVLHHHHTAEDELVWPLLEERAPAQVSEHVLCVVDQHRRVDVAHAAVEAELVEWSRRATEESRDRLAYALERLTVSLIEHMDYEEEYVVPVMEEHIGIIEWNEIVAGMTGGLDPGELLLMLGMTMYEGDSDIIDNTIANMPPEVRVGIRATAALAYADHAQLIHGSATPPRSTEIQK